MHLGAEYRVAAHVGLCYVNATMIVSGSDQYLSHAKSDPIANHKARLTQP
jgi:hypothetical protein